MAISLLQSLQISQLGFQGQTPPVTNPSPLGANGQNTLNASQLDLNNGATPPKYLDNPPQ
jgi:hypothetical protein